MPPRAWSQKDERQYEHIKESVLERGKPEELAEEVAARTVNKQRRLEGRTKSGRKRTTGTGNPNLPLEELTRDELYNRAKRAGVEGRSKMTKGDLVRAVRRSG